MEIKKLPTLSEIISGLKDDILRITEEEGDEKYINTYSIEPDKRYENFEIFPPGSKTPISNGGYGQTFGLIYFHEGTARPYNEEIKELISQIHENKQLSDFNNSQIDVNPVGIIVPLPNPERVLIFQAKRYGEPYKTQSLPDSERSQILDEGRFSTQNPLTIRGRYENKTLEILERLGFLAAHVNLADFKGPTIFDGNLFMKDPDYKDSVILHEIGPFKVCSSVYAYRLIRDSYFINKSK